MGILSMFRKHKTEKGPQQDFNIKTDFMNDTLTKTGIPESNVTKPDYAPIPQPIVEKPPEFQSAEPLRDLHSKPHNNRDMELISAKLDTIKAMLESINHRLTTLEQKNEKDKW